MTTYRGKSAEQINRSMKILFPECSGCNYADYPMLGGAWLKGSDKVPSATVGSGESPSSSSSGGYCFIKTDAEMPVAIGFKTGYVWGSGPFGYGYYHLMTHAAHVTLYHRINNKRVFTGAANSTGVVCGCFGGGRRGDEGPASTEAKISTTLPTIPADDFDDLRVLFHARSVSSKANDGVAAQQQMMDSNNTAQAEYMYGQNIQLGTNVATVAAFAAS